MTQTKRVRPPPRSRTLGGAVVVRVGPVDDRPDEAPGVVVEVDEHLAHDGPREEGDDPVASVEPGIRHEPGREALVQRAEVAEGRPGVVRRRVDRDLPADGGHRVLSSVSVEMGEGCRPGRCRSWTFVLGW